MIFPWFSFSKGWFSGSMFVFAGVLEVLAGYRVWFDLANENWKTCHVGSSLKRENLETKKKKRHAHQLEVVLVPSLKPPPKHIKKNLATSWWTPSNSKLPITLPSAWVQVLPALRNAKISPGMASKTSSKGARESAQPMIAVWGAWPSFQQARGTAMNERNFKNIEETKKPWKLLQKKLLENGSWHTFLLKKTTSSPTTSSTSSCPSPRIGAFPLWCCQPLQYPTRSAHCPPSRVSRLPARKRGVGSQKSLLFIVAYRDADRCVGGKPHVIN